MFLVSTEAPEVGQVFLVNTSPRREGEHRDPAVLTSGIQEASI